MTRIVGERKSCVGLVSTAHSGAGDSAGGSVPGGGNALFLLKRLGRMERPPKSDQLYSHRDPLYEIGLPRRSSFFGDVWGCGRKAAHKQLQSPTSQGSFTGRTL